MYKLQDLINYPLYTHKTRYFNICHMFNVNVCLLINILHLINTFSDWFENILCNTRNSILKTSINCIRVIPETTLINSIIYYKTQKE